MAFIGPWSLKRFRELGVCEVADRALRVIGGDLIFVNQSRVDGLEAVVDETGAGHLGVQVSQIIHHANIK